MAHESTEIARLALLDALRRALGEVARARGSADSLSELQSAIIREVRDLVTEAIAAEGIEAEEQERLLERAIADVNFAFEANREPS